jgi:hypothetical protein
MKTSFKSANPGHVCVARSCPFPVLSPSTLVIRFDIIKTLILLFISLLVILCVKHDLDTHKKYIQF